MLVYYFVPFIVSNRYLLFWVSNGHNSVTVQNRTHVYVNFFHHKDLGNHLLQLCPKVVKHPVYCPLQKEEFRYSCTAIPLHFCTAPATNEALITSCDELLYPLSISDRVTAVSTSRSSSDCWRPRIGSSAGSRLQSPWRHVFPNIITISVGFCYQIKRQANLFSDLSSRTNFSLLYRPP